MLIDDLVISLMVLVGTRFIAFILFFFLFIRELKMKYLVLSIGWLIYMIGPIFEILNPQPDKVMLHPFFAFSAATGTLILMISILLYNKAIKPKIIIGILMSTFIVLCCVNLIYPEIIGSIATLVQGFFLVGMLVILFLKRKQFKSKRSNHSYFWLCLTLILGLTHAFGSNLIWSTAPLSVRFVFTAMINLSLLIFFIYLDWEEIQKQNIASIREKEILLQEVHHRVKNNLMIISSILSIQAGSVEDKDKLDLIHGIENRINTMALVHEQLYRSRNINEIVLSDYITDLTDAIHRSFILNGKPVKVIRELQPVQVDINVLIPIGMLINEIVSNSYKHAFKNNENPELRIRTSFNHDGNCQISIKDNGCGIEEGDLSTMSGSTGFIIIDALIQQLNAELKIFHESGTEFLIKIPAAPEKKQ